MTTQEQDKENAEKYANRTYSGFTAISMAQTDFLAGCNHVRTTDLKEAVEIIEKLANSASDFTSWKEYDNAIAFLQKHKS